MQCKFTLVAVEVVAVVEFKPERFLTMAYKSTHKNKLYFVIAITHPLSESNPSNDFPKRTHND